jgi:tetraacyldisaccharide 4'-kinase
LASDTLPHDGILSVSPAFSQFIQTVMSGEDKRARAEVLRGTLNIAELFYSSVMRLRNQLYNRQIFRSRRLPHPVISVGNITTGGTGKTPVVRWLAEHLRAEGKHPAILSRGYKSEAGGLGDELTMLDRALNKSNDQKIYLAANPDRVAGATSILRDHPDTDVFILDDGFQHRRVARDLDIVLISAANPFGFNHVLPRGLLREPLAGLERANALILTYADQASAQIVESIEQAFKKHNPHAPIYRAIHAQTGLRTSDGSALIPLEELRSRRFFPFAGIGNPTAFDHQLRAFAEPAGYRWFPDHHSYTEYEVRSIREEARKAGAEILVTTEKDWVKIAPLYTPGETLPPIWRVEMELKFLDHDEARFNSQLQAKTGK